MFFKFNYLGGDIIFYEDSTKVVSILYLSTFSAMSARKRDLACLDTVIRKALAKTMSAKIMESSKLYSGWTLYFHVSPPYDAVEINGLNRMDFFFNHVLDEMSCVGYSSLNKFNDNFFYLMDEKIKNYFEYKNK